MRKAIPPVGAVLALTTALAGCGTSDDAAPSPRAVRGAAIGAVAGGVVGNLVAAPGLRTQGAAIGAAVGAALGGAAGLAMDRQRTQLERRFAAERARNDVEVRQLREDVLLLTLSGQLQFETGSATVLPGLRDGLAKVADVVRANPGTRIGIVGHTDSVGSAAFNQQLSERRAHAVRDELIALGLPSDAMFTLGRGASEPRADNATEAGRAANRRVELVLTRPDTA